MKILVRLPNWLGDLVMSAGFCRELHRRYPDAHIHVIVRESLAGLAGMLPGVATIHPVASGMSLIGLVRAGRTVARQGPFDIFFCLPDSFSSAWMGVFCGCRHRIGFRGDLRSVLLTHAFRAPPPMHRADRYADLIARYCDEPVSNVDVRLSGIQPKSGDSGDIIVNINSEASSRRMSVGKWVEVLRLLMAQTEGGIVLIGSHAERAGAVDLISRLGGAGRVRNMAGETNLPHLAALLGSARLLISTDSGPAHLANALGTPSVVLFGAGDDRITAPYDRTYARILRATGIGCAPCVSNVCRFGNQRCLEEISPESIVQTAIRWLKSEDA